MNYPTEAQIDRTANLLATLRENGNRRPGDEHIDHDIAIQLRARATDILVVLLNQEAVFNG